MAKKKSFSSKDEAEFFRKPAMPKIQGMAFNEQIDSINKYLRQHANFKGHISQEPDSDIKKYAHRMQNSYSQLMRVLMDSVSVHLKTGDIQEALGAALTLGVALATYNQYDSIHLIHYGLGRSYGGRARAKQQEQSRREKNRLLKLVEPVIRDEFAQALKKRKRGETRKDIYTRLSKKPWGQAGKLTARKIGSICANSNP